MTLHTLLWVGTTIINHLPNHHVYWWYSNGVLFRKWGTSGTSQSFKINCLAWNLLEPVGLGLLYINEMAQWFRASTMIGSSHLMIDAASKGIPCCLYKRSRQGPVLGSEDSETTDSKLFHFTKVNSRLVAKAYGRRGFPLNPFIFCICHQQRPRGWKRTPLDTGNKYADALHQAGAQDDLFIPWYCTYDGLWWSLFWLGLD